jgi:hypothetical protein
MSDQRIKDTLAERLTTDSANWEAVALSRVARRVEDLPEMPAEAEDFGWEEDILAKLRKRLADY